MRPGSGAQGGEGRGPRAKLVWRNRLNGWAGPLQGSRVFATWMVTMRELWSIVARMHYREVQMSTPA